MKNETQQKLIDITRKLELCKAIVDKRTSRYARLRQEFIDLCTQAVREERPFEKDPQMAKFSFVNHETGKVYGRTKAVSFRYDVEKMKDDPILSAAIQETTVYDVDEDALQKMINDDPAIVVRLQELVEAKKPQIRLSPVREISPEDL